MGSQLIRRSIPLNRLTKQFHHVSKMFAHPTGELLFPDAPAGYNVVYFNRDQMDPNVNPVRFAFAQQRADHLIHTANPPDADPIIGFTPEDLVAKGWDRPGPYGPGRFSQGGHQHSVSQMAIRPTINNRAEQTWIELGNPPVDHTLRLNEFAFQDDIMLGDRMYGNRALSWWPTAYWKKTGEEMEAGNHAQNHYYIAGADGWCGPCVLFPQGFQNVAQPSQASMDSLAKGGWYVGPDRFHFHFGDHNVSAQKIYDITLTMEFPSLLSLDADPTARDAAVYLTKRTDGYRGIYDKNGKKYEGKCWRDEVGTVTGGPDPSLGRDNESWVVVPMLRLFIEFRIPNGGWVPNGSTQGLSGSKEIEYYGRMLTFSTAGKTGWPDHIHGEYLFAASLGDHFELENGVLPDFQNVLDAVSRFTENETLSDTVLWWRGCEAVGIELDPGIQDSVKSNPWPEPVEDWDGSPIEKPPPGGLYPNRRLIVLEPDEVLEVIQKPRL